MRTLFSLFLFFFLTAPCLATQPLLLGTFAGPPLSNENRTGFYDRVIQEAFKRINLRIDIEHLPAERSLANADAGITAGDFVRISGLEKLYPNLVMVPEKITDFEFVAFSKTLRLKTSSWETLKPFDVAIVRGWKILEKNLVGTHSLTFAHDQNQLFNLLVNDRADIIVYSRFEGYALIRSQGLDGIKALEPPLDVREMYLYLNKKHLDLVQPLAKALRKMKEDGTYTEIKNKTLGDYLPGNHD